MTKYNSNIHTVEYKSIDIYYRELETFIKELQDFKETVLQKYPEAFDFRLDTNDGETRLQYFRNKTQQELDNIKAYQERQSKVEYQTYLDLKRKFEGN